VSTKFFVKSDDVYLLHIIANRINNLKAKVVNKADSRNVYNFAETSKTTGNLTN